MIKKLLILLLLFPFVANAQTFYVEPTEYGYENKIIDKLRYDGYKVVKTEAEATHKVECFATGQYNAFSLKDMFHGYAKLTDLKSGLELARTKEIGTNAYNVKQAGNRIMATIAKKHMKTLIPLK